MKSKTAGHRLIIPLFKYVIIAYVRLTPIRRAITLPIAHFLLDAAGNP
jgi:hypothetical protein